MPNKLLEHENFWRLCAISGEYFDTVWGFYIEQSVGSCFFGYFVIFGNKKIRKESMQI